MASGNSSKNQGSGSSAPLSNLGSGALGGAFPSSTPDPGVSALTGALQNNVSGVSGQLTPQAVANALVAGPNNGTPDPGGSVYAKGSGSATLTPTPQPQATPVATPPKPEGGSAPTPSPGYTHGTFNPAAFATNEPVAQSPSQAPATPAKSGMGDIGGFLSGLFGGAANIGGGFLSAVGRGASAAGGTGELNANYMQQKQDYAKELQNNQIQNEQIQNLRNIARDYGLNEQTLVGQYGPSANRLGYEAEIQPYSANIDIAKNAAITPYNAATEVEKNREMMSNKFGYIQKLLGSLGGSGGGYPPGSVQSMKLPNGQPDVKSIVGSALQPGGVKNTAIDPYQQAMMEQARTNRMLGLLGSL